MVVALPVLTAALLLLGPHLQDGVMLHRVLPWLWRLADEDAGHRMQVPAPEQQQLLAALVACPAAEDVQVGTAVRLLAGCAWWFATVHLVVVICVWSAEIGTMRCCLGLHITWLICTSPGASWALWHMRHPYAFVFVFLHGLCPSSKQRM